MWCCEMTNDYWVVRPNDIICVRATSAKEAKAKVEGTVVEVHQVGCLVFEKRKVA